MYETKIINDITELKLYLSSILLNKSTELAESIKNSINFLSEGTATVSNINKNIINNRLDIMITHSGTTNHQISNSIASGYINFIEENENMFSEDLFNMYKNILNTGNISSLYNITYINTGKEDFCNEINCIIIL